MTDLLPVDATMISRLPKVEIIAAFGVGYDHIDVAAAKQHNAVVTHTPDVLTRGDGRRGDRSADRDFT